MSDQLDARSMLEPVDDISGIELPPRFAEALGQVRAMIASCEDAHIPNDTLLAALLTELMPRLVHAYGPAGVASVLGRLSSEISSAGMPPLRTQ